MALIQQHRLQLRVNTDFAPYGLDEPYRVFISEDPIGFEGGDVNLMAYVGNNPVLLIDPNGLELRIYNRPVDGGPLSWIGANHAFLYSTEEDIAWGTSGSSGSGAQTDETRVINK